MFFHFISFLHHEMTPLFQHIIPLPHCQYHSWYIDKRRPGHQQPWKWPVIFCSQHSSGVVVVRLNQCTCHMSYPMTCALIPFLHVKWEAFDVCWLNFYAICMTGTTIKALNRAARTRCMNLSEWNISFDVGSTSKQIETTHRKLIAHHPGLIVFSSTC